MPPFGGYSPILAACVCLHLQTRCEHQCITDFDGKLRFVLTFHPENTYPLRFSSNENRIVTMRALLKVLAAIDESLLVEFQIASLGDHSPVASLKRSSERLSCILILSIQSSCGHKWQHLITTQEKELNLG